MTGGTEQYLGALISCLSCCEYMNLVLPPWSAQWILVSWVENKKWETEKLDQFDVNLGVWWKLTICEYDGGLELK